MPRIGFLPLQGVASGFTEGPPPDLRFTAEVRVDRQRDDHRRWCCLNYHRCTTECAISSVRSVITAGVAVPSSCAGGFAPGPPCFPARLDPHSSEINGSSATNRGMELRHRE
jgi:hypothetical protein